MTPIPSAEQQLAFLDHIQRLFEEGEFVATYKYALLLAITELAVDCGADSGDSLDLPISAIADKFLELYWPHVVPYGSGNQSGVLVQNNGRQAATVSLLCELRARHGTLPKARISPDWRAAKSQTVVLLKKMPLWRLQVLRRQKVEFLYSHSQGDSIRLFPGVMYNLRRFHGFLLQLGRSAWIAHIRANPQNATMIGDAADLEQVLFGADRASLAVVRPVLRELQSDGCFYCQAPLRSEGEVDHFIPWSRYPRDLAQNFVLAHKACNGDKRDMLAATHHLENWHTRNAYHAAVLTSELGRYFASNQETMLRVARWSYHHAYIASAQTWSAPKQFIALSDDYLRILDA